MERTLVINSQLADMEIGSTDLGEPYIGYIEVSDGNETIVIYYTRRDSDAVIRAFQQVRYDAPLEP